MIVWAGFYSIGFFYWFVCFFKLFTKTVKLAGQANEASRHVILSSIRVAFPGQQIKMDESDMLLCSSLPIKTDHPCCGQLYWHRGFSKPNVCISILSFSCVFTNFCLPHLVRARLLAFSPLMFTTQTAPRIKYLMFFFISYFYMEKPSVRER